MKKILSLMLAALIMFTVCACDRGDTPDDGTTTSSDASVPNIIEVEDSVLKTCIGQADKDGVYTVPDNITMINESCFANDTTLKKVIIPSSVKTIGAGAFSGCTSLSEVVMTESVTSIGAYAFFNCVSLAAIDIPSSVRKISSYCFKNCISLESLVIPEGVRTISYEAFAGCVALDSVKFPSSLEEIYYGVFSNCTSLSDVDFSDCTQLQTFGGSAFSSCTALKRIELPQGLKTIDSACFFGCSSLTSVTIPQSVNSIGEYALNQTPWFLENTDDYLIVGDGVLIKCNVNAKFVDLSGKGIKVIGGTAFWNDKLEIGSTESRYGYKYADQLKTIVIPEGVTDIQARAFYYCMALTDVTLPSTLKTVGANAFDLGYAEKTNTEYYAALDIDLSPCKKLTSIGIRAFYGCSETDEIVLPDTIEYVGSDAFCMTKSYMVFYKEASVLTECSYKVINGVHLWTCVPSNATEIVIPTGVRIIGGGACGGWDNVVIVTDTTGLSPYWVTKFNITNNITSVKIPDGVETVCDNAFYYIAEVRELVFPDSLKSLGYMSLGRLMSLSSVTLSPNLEQIESAAFWSCMSLERITLPDSLEYIGSQAFNDCMALKILYIPENTLTVGSEIFSASCTSLTHVYMSPELRPEIYDIIGGVSSEMLISYYG